MRGLCCSSQTLWRSSVFYDVQDDPEPFRAKDLILWETQTEVYRFMLINEAGISPDRWNASSLQRHHIAPLIYIVQSPSQLTSISLWFLGWWLARRSRPCPAGFTFIPIRRLQEPIGWGSWCHFRSWSSQTITWTLLDTYVSLEKVFFMGFS